MRERSAGCTHRACRQEEGTVRGASLGQADAHQKLTQTAQKAEGEVILFAQRRVRSRNQAFLLPARGIPGEPGRLCSCPLLHGEVMSRREEMDVGRERRPPMGEKLRAKSRLKVLSASSNSLLGKFLPKGPNSSLFL